MIVSGNIFSNWQFGRFTFDSLNESDLLKAMRMKNTEFQYLFFLR